MRIKTKRCASGIPEPGSRDPNSVPAGVSTIRLRSLALSRIFGFRRFDPEAISPVSLPGCLHAIPYCRIGDPAFHEIDILGESKPVVSAVPRPTHPDGEKAESGSGTTHSSAVKSSLIRGILFPRGDTSLAADLTLTRFSTARIRINIELLKIGWHLNPGLFINAFADPGEYGC